jgi:hypothetical protein
MLAVVRDLRRSVKTGERGLTGSREPRRWPKTEESLKVEEEKRSGGATVMRTTPTRKMRACRRRERRERIVRLER